MRRRLRDPKLAASSRIVRFVRSAAHAIKTRCASERDHGRPRRRSAGSRSITAREPTALADRSQSTCMRRGSSLSEVWRSDRFGGVVWKADARSEQADAVVAQVPTTACRCCGSRSTPATRAARPHRDDVRARVRDPARAPARRPRLAAGRTGRPLTSASGIRRRSVTGSGCRAPRSSMPPTRTSMRRRTCGGS